MIKTEERSFIIPQRWIAMNKITDKISLENAWKPVYESQ